MPAPIVTATLQAAVLSATSNILAQAIAAYREDKPFTLSPLPILQFVLFALLNTPVNFLWQQWLEETFPKSGPPAHSSSSAERLVNGKPGAEVAKDRAAENSETLNVRNTFVKFALDQTVGAVVNTVLFIAGIGAIKGQSGEQIRAAVKQEFLPLLIAGVKLWPLVSLISFVVVPAHSRILFGSICNMAWGIYLSLLAAH